MDFQALCEIAERELNVGLADPNLAQRSLAEANGVAAHARQIFWHHRATQLLALQQSEGPRAIEALVSEIAAREKRLRRRKESYRWFWALTCVAAMLGAIAFPFGAFGAIGKVGPRFAISLVLSIASLALAIISYLASRYHTDTE